MAKQKYKLGKMTTTKIRKLAESGIPEAKKYLETRGLSSNERKYARRSAAYYKTPKGKKAAAEMKRIGAMFKDVGAGKQAKKAVAKKTVGKLVGKLIPGVGAAIIARDVIKGVSKATCGKRGGKWVSGKCVGTKKTKFKPGSKVRDPISKR